MELTKPGVWQERLSAGKAFMSVHVRRAERNIGRYKSSDRLRTTSTGDRKQMDSLPVGEVNYPAINIRQMVAAIAHGNPDWKVEAATPEDAQRVRKYLRKKFKALKVPRIGRRCLLDRALGAQGYAQYGWDAKGFFVEHVHPRDLAFDPHVTDETWNSPRWAMRRIKLPRREAEQRFGARVLGTDGAKQDAFASEEDESGSGSRSIQIWVGWDAKTEVEMLDGAGKDSGTREAFSSKTEDNEVLDDRPNLYGRVPLVVLQGDHDPDNEFSLSDYDTVAGAHEMQRRLQNIMNNQARNGGGIPWFRSEYVSSEQADQLTSGELEDPLEVTGAPGEAAVGFTPNQQMNQAVLESLQYVGAGIDADQAITQQDRGVVTDHAGTATEATLTASRSTSRGAMKRQDYEDFLVAIAEACIELTLKFGLDPKSYEGAGPDEEQVALYQALQGVTEVQIIEESASFKDPAMEMQTSMQLLGVAAQVFPITLQTGQPLDIWGFLDDALRSSNRKDLSKYRLSPEATQQLMQQMQEQAQSAQGGAQKGPKQPSESLNYKDAPPDIQRQIEEQAGLQPSEIGVQAGQAHEAQMQDAKQKHETGMLVAKGMLEEQKQTADQAHEAEISEREQIHDRTMAAHQAQAQSVQQSQQHSHESSQNTQKLQGQAGLASLQHVSQMRLARMGQGKQGGPNGKTGRGNR